MIKTIALTLLPLATFSMFNVVNDFNNSIPQPVKISMEDTRLTEIRQALRILGRDEKHAHALWLSAQVAQMDPVKWTYNIERESEFKITAKSHKGYKGLGQTPKAVMKTGFEVGDLTYAACVYNEKLKIAKGNEHLALMLYKGGNNPAAEKCALLVENGYTKLRKQMNEIKENEKNAKG